MELFRDPFKRYLFIALAALYVFLLLRPTALRQETAQGGEVHFFFHPQCPHCEAQQAFNEGLREKYPSLKWVPHDVSIPGEAKKLRDAAVALGMSAADLKVPTTVFGSRYVVGFEKAETSGTQIEAMISGQELASLGPPGAKSSIKLPFLGSVDVRGYSLGLLAVILGLVDGFNPCAMWVLVYMISLIITLKDRRKMWWLVGTFVFASGVLYFLFLGAWLNAFLYLGYLRPISLLIGLFALGAGIGNLKDFLSGAPAVCRVEPASSRKKTTAKISRIVQAPLNAAGIFAIVILAFAVNSIEFVCSAGIPALFTHVLALTPLPAWKHYGYLLLYDFFFMLDDLVIFGTAAVAAGSSLGEKYARWAKLAGGVLLVALGVLLVFFPGRLR